MCTLTGALSQAQVRHTWPSPFLSLPPLPHSLTLLSQTNLLSFSLRKQKQTKQVLTASSHTSTDVASVVSCPPPFLWPRGSPQAELGASARGSLLPPGPDAVSRPTESAPSADTRQVLAEALLATLWSGCHHTSTSRPCADGRAACHGVSKPTLPTP